MSVSLSIIDLLWRFLLVGALWGCTNPLLNKGGTNAITNNRLSDAERLKMSRFRRLLYETWTLLSNWRVLPQFSHSLPPF
jgi:hypothetical protein